MRFHNHLNFENLTGKEKLHKTLDFETLILHSLYEYAINY